MIKHLSDCNLLNGTSFFGIVVYATANSLTKLFGEPFRDIDSKTQYEWRLEYEGIPFAIYDWKEPEIDPDESIGFHIGAKTKEDSVKVYTAIKRKLKRGSNSRRTVKRESNNY